MKAPHLDWDSTNGNLKDAKGIKIKLETAKDQFDMVGDYDDGLPPDSLTGVPQIITVPLPDFKGFYQAPKVETVIAHAHGPSKSGSALPKSPVKKRVSFEASFGPNRISETVGKAVTGKAKGIPFSTLTVTTCPHS